MGRRLLQSTWCLSPQATRIPSFLAKPSRLPIRQNDSPSLFSASPWPCPQQRSTSPHMVIRSSPAAGSARNGAASVHTSYSDRSSPEHGGDNDGRIAGTDLTGPAFRFLD